MINITQKPCSNWNERDGFKPEIIVVHIAAGSLSSMDSWFAFKGSMVSAHYGTSEDGKEVHQYVAEDKAAWGCGKVRNPSFKLFKPNINPNKYTINIENAGVDLSLASSAQLSTLSELIKDIAGRYKIPLDRDHIIGHYEVNPIDKPFCPSKTHSVMDKLVSDLTAEEWVCVMCPRSKVELTKMFIKNLK